ncbi:MAG: DUF2793 domain-containing protein [Magnetospiraceae bacterium]
MATTPRESLELLAANADNKEIKFNENMKKIEVLLQTSVIDKDLTAPPGGESEGDLYVVGASATGDWAGQDGNVAYYYNAAWEFYTPREGWWAFVEDENIRYEYVGSAWQEMVVSGGFFNDHDNVTLPVIDRDLTAPPGGEADGDIYWINGTGTGGWAGNSNKFAGWDGVNSVWQYHTPVEGDVMWVEDEDLLLRYDGSAWVGNPWEVALFLPGLPAASAIATQLVATRAVTLPSGLTGSQGYALTAPADGAVTFDIQKNGVSIGSVNIAQSANTATFTFSSAQSLAAGDRLTIYTPGTQDSAMANVSITLVGELT